jgi:hypothetical protein
LIRSRASDRIHDENIAVKAARKLPAAPVSIAIDLSSRAAQPCEGHGCARSVASWVARHAA